MGSDATTAPLISWQILAQIDSHVLGTCREKVTATRQLLVLEVLRRDSDYVVATVQLEMTRPVNKRSRDL